jgi:hypothetical protein
MTDQITTSSPTASSTSGKVEQAKDVASDAVGRAQTVAGEAGEQAKAVARDARDQVRQLVDRTRRNLDDEARNRSRQAAGGLRTFAEQLGALASGDTAGAGAMGDYARQGRERLTRLADRLEDGPSAVLDDVRRFARRQPALFLAAAGAVGFVAGRMLRAGKEATGSDDTAGGQDGHGPQALAAPGPEALVAPDVPPVFTATAGGPGMAVPAQDPTP